VPEFFSKQHRQTDILRMVKDHDPHCILRGMRDQYRENPDGVGRLLDVAHELRLLELVLADSFFPLVLDFATLATGRQFLNLPLWLNRRLLEAGLPLYIATLGFLVRKLCVIATMANKAQDPDAQQLLQSALHCAAGAEAELGVPTCPTCSVAAVADDVILVFIRVLRSHSYMASTRVAKPILDALGRVVNLLLPGVFQQMEHDRTEMLTQPSYVQFADQVFAQYIGGKCTINDVVARISKTLLSRHNTQR
ncbi:hypothetical protein KIPB_010963, partial [Kipferlia bialata]